MPEEKNSKNETIEQTSPESRTSPDDAAVTGDVPVDEPAAVADSALDDVDRGLEELAQALDIDSDAPEHDSNPEDIPKNEMPSLPDFSEMLSEAAAGSIDLLKDVQLNVKIELGRAEMTVDNILKLANGSVVELNKLAGDPVDVLVNDQLVARGEVLVLNDNFCVRINEIVKGMTEKLAMQ